jgi:hypothetical protein
MLKTCMDTKYIRILEYLAQYHIGHEVDVLPVINEVFPNEMPNGVYYFFERMLSNHHVSFNYNPFDKYPDPFKVSLKINGLDYLYAHYLREATLRSYKNQGWSNKVTWGIAIGAIVISTVASIWLGVSNKSLEERIYRLEQERQPAKEKTKAPSFLPKHIDTLRKNWG